ncbi:MAG: alpha-glucosidase/alpha-galactosidase, partial [Clostridia bacterium]
MKTPKIVFIGAGSMSFGIPTFKDIFSETRFQGSTLSLVDVDKENLERMYELAQTLNRHTGLGITVEKHLERRDALPGADFVVNSIAIERCDLWRHDFHVPQAFGVRHTLGENGGPGALFFTMRTLPLVMDIVRDMEALCPEAWFLNFSNPESRIVLCVARYSRVKCIGLCHGIFDARRDIARILNRAPESIELLAGGMNHFQWVKGIADIETRTDLYPLFREKEATYNPTFAPYSRKMFHYFGLYPTPSDDHLGEYQAYGHEAGVEGYDFQKDERERIAKRAEIQKIVTGEMDLTQWLKPSGEQAVVAITALFFGDRHLIPSAVVYNDGAIPQLPPDIAVEVPILVDGDGVHKTQVDWLPAGIIAMLNQQVSP